MASLVLPLPLCTLAFVRGADTASLWLQVAMKECPTTGFPFVSISCEGEYCSTLYQPCSSNSDCSSTQSCQELISKEKIIGFLKVGVSVCVAVCGSCTSAERLSPPISAYLPSPLTRSASPSLPRFSPLLPRRSIHTRPPECKLDH